MEKLNISIEHFHRLFCGHPHSIIIGKCSRNETVDLPFIGECTAPDKYATYYIVQVVGENNTYISTEFIGKWW